MVRPNIIYVGVKVMVSISILVIEQPFIHEPNRKWSK